MRKEIEIDVKNKDVLIVEYIIDSGLSMCTLIDYIKSLHPRTVRICALIDKSERREINIDVDYIGRVVKEGFLVGYGLILRKNIGICQECIACKPNES